MHIKKGDKVKIIAGKDRKLGPSEVLAVLPRDNRVIVQGRNLVKKHIKGVPGTGRESRIEEVEAALHASNVQLWSDKLGQPVRTQYRWVGADDKLFTNAAEATASLGGEAKARKVRYAVKSEEIFE